MWAPIDIALDFDDAMVAAAIAEGERTPLAGLPARDAVAGGALIMELEDAGFDLTGVDVAIYPASSAQSMVVLSTDDASAELLAENNDGEDDDANGDLAFLGYKLALATQTGDPAQIEAAKQALTLAEARRLASFDREGDPPISARSLHRNVLGELLVAQIKLLGGNLNSAWDPPPADAPPEQRKLYENYCRTRVEIERDFDDDLSYIPNPPCP